MDILVACHNEATDPKLFKYFPPLFDTPVPLIADYVDPYTSGHKWKDYDAESKDIIWDQYCPIMWSFQGARDYLYHDSIFYDLFNTGWKILKPGGKIVFPFPKDFTSIYGKPIDIKTALANFKIVLKRLLGRHPWSYYIVKKENMPFIISEYGQQERYNMYIFLVKPTARTNNRGIEMVNMTRKKRKSRRGHSRRC